MEKNIKNILLGITLVGCLLVLANVSSAHAQANTFTPTPYSDQEIANPSRGQYRAATEAAWNRKQANGTFSGLGREFPNSSTENSVYGTWPTVGEQNFRVTWRSLEDGSGNYDFRAIDDMLTRAKAMNSRISLRVMAMETSSQPPVSGNLYSALPDRFTGNANLSETVTYGSNQYVIPMWDNNVYLTELTKLLNALGERYNKNEYLASFEISGLGNFGEWHVYPFADHYEGTDRPWSQATLERVINANVSAFPDTQLIGFVSDQRGSKYVLSPSPAPKKPIGFRIDSLGVQDMDANESRMNEVPGVNQRWKTAPLNFEYASSDSTPNFNGGLYQAARQQVQQYHGSAISSANFPHTYNGQTMTPKQYDDWSAANKYAGYRYSVAQVQLPVQTVPPGSSVPFGTIWRNQGVAPTYDNWSIEYSLRPKGGSADVLASAISPALDLKTLYYDANPFAGFTSDPLTQSKLVTNSLQLPSSIDPGVYDVYVKVLWNERKQGATALYQPQPMFLSMASRTADGAYLLGDITVAIDVPPVVPEVPNTGFDPTATKGSPLGAAIASSFLLVGLIIITIVGRRYSSSMTN